MIESLFQSLGSENVTLSACVSILLAHIHEDILFTVTPNPPHAIAFPLIVKNVKRKEKRNPSKQAIHGSSGAVEAHPHAFLCCHMFGSSTFHSCQGCQILRSVFYFSWLPSYQS